MNRFEPRQRSAVSSSLPTCLLSALLWSLPGALAMGVLHPSAARAQTGTPRNYVVVVGNNQSVESSTPPLRYADDDAARFVELLSPVAAKVSLLTVMDATTQRIHPDLPSRSLAPTKANLFAELAAINALMEEDRARGDSPSLILVYIGHGHLGGDGAGYVSFLDGALTGEELFSGVIAPSRAVFNHLIFDACNSYLLIAGRGETEEAGPDVEEAVLAYLDRRALARHPNTGFLFSTRQARESHEWSVFQGGVFSHEVRSALAGAADVNADGRIEYSEVDAFLAAANLAVADPRARLEAFIQAPAQDRNQPVMDLGSGQFRHFLKLPETFSGRFYLEDARGVRYLDGNKTTESAAYVALAGTGDYFLRQGEAEARLQLLHPGTIDLGAVAFGPPAHASRGSLAEEFRHALFGVPYGPGFYYGFVARTAHLPARRLERPFPPLPLRERASTQPLKNPYARGEPGVKRDRATLGASGRR